MLKSGPDLLRLLLSSLLCALCRVFDDPLLHGKAYQPAESSGGRCTAFCLGQSRGIVSALSSIQSYSAMGGMSSILSGVLV